VDATKCGAEDLNFVTKWMHCLRWMALNPFLFVLFGLALVAQGLALVLYYMRGSVVPGSVFICHSPDAPNAPPLAGVPKAVLARRFEFNSNTGSDPFVNTTFRSCSSKPVRRLIKESARSQSGSFVDDGRGF
jgi:hypothetical protein